MSGIGRYQWENKTVFIGEFGRNQILQGTLIKPDGGKSKIEN